jgi:hypothetical protein
MWPFSKKDSVDSPGRGMVPIGPVVLTDEEHEECQAFVCSVIGQKSSEGNWYMKKELVEPFKRSLIAQCMMGRAERFAIFASSPGKEDYIEKACVAAAKAVGMYPLSMNLYDFACILHKVGKHEEAKMVFKEFLRKHESSPPNPVDEMFLKQRDVIAAVRHATHELSK